MKRRMFSRQAILVSFLFLWLLPPARAQLIDSKATPETKALFRNLKELSARHTLFGHQHATEYGHGWYGDADRSDVKSVTGSHPAVIGVDLMGLSGQSEEQIQWNFNALRDNIVATYNRGGITTVAWHFNNPTSPGGFYWNDSVSKPAIQLMLPGASHHEEYKTILQRVARLALAVKGNDGSLAPLIFRPYHEMDGNWFWWGAAHCSPDQFKQIWRFTVAYLRDSLNVHNFIYAFSPDCLFNSEEEFLQRYPGHEWVDMVGMDNYADMGRDGSYNLEAALRKLQIVSDFAKKNNKLAAFTETGLESIPNTRWWTDVLLRLMKTDGLQLSYVLVWRNDQHSPTHYYAPFPGHRSVPDFMRFYKDPFTLFEKDLPPMYK